MSELDKIIHDLLDEIDAKQIQSNMYYNKRNEERNIYEKEYTRIFGQFGQGTNSKEIERRFKYLVVEQSENNFNLVNLEQKIIYMDLVCHMLKRIDDGSKYYKDKILKLEKENSESASLLQLRKATLEKAIKDLEKAKSPAIKGGNRSPKYDPYEKTILRVLAEYASGENQLRSKADKLTSARAIEKIENEIDNSDGIESSVFFGWLKKYKESNGEFIFNGTKGKK